jgi:hypothetical protein
MSRLLGCPAEQTPATTSTASDANLARQLEARATAASEHAATLREAAAALATMPKCECYDPDQDDDDDDDDDD